MSLTPIQHARAIGVLVGTAAGDGEPRKNTHPEMHCILNHGDWPSSWCRLRVRSTFRK